MIVIKDVKFFEHDMDWIKMPIIDQKARDWDLSNPINPMNETFEVELIESQTFRLMEHGRMREVKIGLSAKARESIGIVFDIVEAQTEQINDAFYKVIKLQQDAAMYKKMYESSEVWGKAWKVKTEELLSMTWWQKIKFFFKGNI